MSASITASTANKMEQVSVGHMEELLREIGGRESKGGRIFLLFCGDIDEASGKSWCSDCVKAEPVIDKVLQDLAYPEDVLIRCTVGNRERWRDAENVFRKHPKLELKGVPTLMQWGTQKKLGDEDCSKENLVRLLLERED